VEGCIFGSSWLKALLVATLAFLLHATFFWRPSLFILGIFGFEELGVCSVVAVAKRPLDHRLR